MQDYRALNIRNYKKPFDVIRCGYVELAVTDLERSRHWYVDVLGFVETARTPDALYLRGLEEGQHHSLVLRKAAEPMVLHLGFKVSCPEDLDLLEELCEQRGLPTRRQPAGVRLALGETLQIRDPAGLPVEFYYDIDKVNRLHQRFDLYRGAEVMRFDHFNCAVADIDEAFAFWTDGLGFRVSEYTDTDSPDYRLYAAWLHRKPNVHDMALTNIPGPRMHHFAYWTADMTSVLRACDVLAASGFSTSIERGPGRHGLSNAFFLYLRDPDGHRLELYNGDYLTADPDGEPLRWSINDPRRQTFWGTPAPRSWFEESSLCQNWEGTGTTPVKAPERPAHVPFVS